MLAPDRRTFLAAAGLAIAEAGSFATSPPPPMDLEETLKAPDGPAEMTLPAGATGRLGGTGMRIRGYMNALQFSPNGTALVSATGGELRGWDPRTGKVLFRFNYPSDGTVDSGRLTSKDTFMLLVAPRSGNSPELRHYAFGTGKLMSRAKLARKDRRQQTAFSVDGSRMAIVHDAGLSLHDTATGKDLWSVEAPAQNVTACEFFADGNTIAVASPGRIALYAAKDGKAIRTLTVPARNVEADKTPPASPVNNLAISADGKWVAATVGDDEDTVACWDVTSEAPKHQLKPAGKPLGFSADGAELVTMFGGKVTFWTVASGKPGRKFAVPKDETHLSPDGKTIAVRTGDCVVLIDTATGQPLAHSADPPGAPVALRFAGPDRLLARLDAWGGWVEWETKTGRETMIRPPDVDGQVPVSLSADGRVALYRTDKEANYAARDRTSGTVLLTGKGDPDANDASPTLAMTPDGKTLVSPTADGLAVVTEAGRHLIPRPGATQGMSTLVITDGRTVAVGYSNTGEHGLVDLYDLAARIHLRRLVIESDPEQLALSPDGSRLAVAFGVNQERRGASIQDTLTVFDVRTGRTVFQAEPAERLGQQLLAFSPNGRHLLRLLGEGGIGVIEVASGRVRTRIEAGPDASINALAFSPDGRTLAASVYGGPVFLWDLYGGAECEALGFDLPGAWECLGGVEAGPAFLAVRALIAKGAAAVSFLSTRLRPITPPDAKRLAGHVADLDHRDFRKREAAFTALRALGELAHDALKKALAAGPSPEVRERIDKLLAEDERPSAEELRQLRAVEVVEHAGGPDARKLLAHWASGAAGTRFTLEAAAAAKRVGERAN